MARQTKEKKIIKIEPSAFKSQYNLEAEKSILSCMLSGESIASAITALIKENDFYDNRNKLIYRAMAELVGSTKQADPVTLYEKLTQMDQLEQAGGLDYIMTVNAYLPSASNYKEYCEIVKRHSVLRNLITASANIASIAEDAENERDALSYAEKQIFDISKVNQTTTLLPVASVFDRVINRINLVHSDRNAFKGVLTGYPLLDRTTNGLQKGDLILLAARPACGKTSFAMNLASYAALQGKVVAVFSLEMSIDQLLQRMMFSLSRQDMSAGMQGNLTRDQLSEVNKSGKRLASLKLYIDDNSLTNPTEILSKCRRLSMEQGRLDLVIIDYLQLMKSTKEFDNRQSEVTELSRMMKIAARELNVPIVLLSQMSRDVEKRSTGNTPAKPQLSDLRESGAIEQDADIVMFLYNTASFTAGETEREVKLMIAKHRNGSTCILDYIFHSNYVYFEEVKKENQSDFNLYEQVNNKQKVENFVNKAVHENVSAALGSNLTEAPAPTERKSDGLTNAASVLTDEEKIKEVARSISPTPTDAYDTDENAPTAVDETHTNGEVSLTAEDKEMFEEPDGDMLV